ncbi:HEPN domain-containing protein [Streptomyces sp. NPDC050256]|uniref:HEPN domain-containing protein n=1 Tax=Streptomyces sp. NPDC050256 TaxID=3365607 RepID=UPI003791BEB4
MPSPRYKTLARRISELRENLLPRDFDELGLYSERVYERTRGFRVLAHAEFESYVEDRAIEVVNKAHITWGNKGEIRPCLLALMSHREAKMNIPDTIADLTDRSPKFPTLNARIEAAKRQYTTYAKKQNHGIKERNLLQLLLPLGVTKDEINTSWLSTTESWASERGEIAHTSAKMQVQINPRTELFTVREILKGFKQIDEILNSK